MIDPSANRESYEGKNTKFGPQIERRLQDLVLVGDTVSREKTVGQWPDVNELA